MSKRLADDQVWPTCSHTDCRGVPANGFARCLRHLQRAELDQVLRRLHPGSDLDARGTYIDTELLSLILQSLQDEDERPTFGRVLFTGAQFTETADFRAVSFADDAVFTDVQFTGPAAFVGAKFTKDVNFDGAQFSEYALFYGVQFAGEAKFSNVQFDDGVWFGSPMFSGGAQFMRSAEFDRAHFAKLAMFATTRFAGSAGFTRSQFAENAFFHDAQFAGEAWFIRAEFGQDAIFDSAEFSTMAWFSVAQFTGDASFQRAKFNDANFGGTRFQKDANFMNVRFEEVTTLGPLAAGSLNLEWAEFIRPLAAEVAAGTISCHDTAWRAGVTLRVRYATISLVRATFSMPSFVPGSDQLFKASAGPLNEERVRKDIMDERGESADLWMPIVTSLRGSDVANLHITDVDLSQCRFAGALLLDQLRFEGRCLFDHPPHGVYGGWAWLPVWRWSNRQSIAEERTWRATTRKRGGWSGTPSAKGAEIRPERLSDLYRHFRKARESAQDTEIGPERLSGLYRQLRKAQEDVKNEPGAANFYYGEMEMRRHARSTPVAERAIIWLYWLISGYGLRALRSLAALAILGVIVTTALTGWGLIATAPTQHLVGTVTTVPSGAARINGTLTGIAPALPPVSQRWTGERAQTAAEVTLESFVFRSTDQPLTTAGTWTTIAARILGPLLVALALLAVRNRIKR